MKVFYAVIFAVCFPLVVGGCGMVRSDTKLDPVASRNAEAPTGAEGRVATGMSGEEVRGVLGTPATIAPDGGGGEVWVYDRVSTGWIEEERSGEGSSLLLHNGGDSGAAAPRRMFRVIVTLDGATRVREFSYHTSRF